MRFELKQTFSVYSNTNYLKEFHAVNFVVISKSHLKNLNDHSLHRIEQYGHAQKHTAYIPNRAIELNICETKV